MWRDVLKGPWQPNRVGIMGRGGRDEGKVFANDIEFILFCLISFPHGSSFSILSRVFRDGMWNIYTFTVLTFALRSYS